MEEAWKRWLRENHNCAWRDREIERLKTEVERMISANEHWHTRVLALNEENERLREALRKISKVRGDADKIVCLANIGICRSIALRALGTDKPA